jgi:ankyrin repeat protein
LILQAHGLEIVTTGATPFWLAASYGDVAIMRILKERGADPHLTTDDGTTPLMAAAGVDFVEGQDKYGRRWFALDTTPQLARARDAVLYCLQLGADINAANQRGQTPLIGAVYYRSPSFVKFMVEHGARINVVNERGQTPWLITQGEYRSGSFLTDNDTGALLVSLGADVTLGKDLGPEYRAGRGR